MSHLYFSNSVYAFHNYFIFFSQLTSYGGELKYTVHYEIEGSRQSYTSDPDVIIKVGHYIYQ